jgi:hypothetical protein
MKMLFVLSALLFLTFNFSSVSFASDWDSLECTLTSGRQYYTMEHHVTVRRAVVNDLQVIVDQSSDRDFLILSVTKKNSKKRLAYATLVFPTGNRASMIHLEPLEISVLCTGI